MGSAEKRERRTKTRNFITPEYFYHDMGFQNFDTYMPTSYREGMAWKSRKHEEGSHLFTIQEKAMQFSV